MHAATSKVENSTHWPVLLTYYDRKRHF